jgi:hypothetical protein
MSYIRNIYRSKPGVGALARESIVARGYAKAPAPAAPCTGKPRLRIIRGGRQ